MIERIQQSVYLADGQQSEQQFRTMLNKILATPYANGVYDMNKTTRVIQHCVNRGHLSVLEHCNITMECTTNIATYKDFTRHRHCAFTIESTSFVRYDVMRIITVHELDQIETDLMLKLQALYSSIKDVKVARDFLPQCCAARMIITANIREWRHIIGVRGDTNDNPLTNQLRDLIWKELNKWYPFFFPLEDNTTDNSMCIYNGFGAPNVPAKLTGK